MLSRSIYTGQRLKANLTALTVVSVFTALLGVALIVMELITRQPRLIVISAVTLLGGVSCAFCAAVLKNKGTNNKETKQMKKLMVVAAIVCAAVMDLMKEAEA